MKELLFRLMFAGETAVLILLCLGLRLHMDELMEERGRYRPIYSAAFLPFFLFLGFPILLLINPGSGRMLLSLLLQALLCSAVYALLLLTLTPLLRRRLSAKGCAALWVLPNFLMYWLMMMWSTVTRMKHRFLIRLPRTVFLIILGLWAAGFLISLLWRVVSHLRFRSSLLQNAREAGPRERSLLRQIRSELKAKPSEIHPGLRVLYSPAAASPLSVGLLRRKTCLVLPRRDYSDEELRMIFRHELIHLMHQDNKLKLTLAIICAAGWFIPSLWAGMGKAAEELELCCDELATDGMDAEARRRYADLLLQNAGSAKGFTTCLSASASGLRYRLGRVLRPEKRRFGVFLIAGISALFAFCYGFVGFALEAGSFRSEVLDRDGGGWQVCRVFPYGLPTTEEASTNAELCRNTEALLAELALDETPDVDLRSDHQLGVIWLTRDGGAMAVAVYDTGMVFYPKGEEGGARIVFLYRSPVDLTPIFAAAGESE